MNNQSEITNSHLLHKAIVYQSTGAQAEHNHESIQMCYKVVNYDDVSGWQKGQIQVIDDDLSVSGAGLVSLVKREGFTKMTTNQTGIVLRLEASRLVRKNADWYKLLLDLCGENNSIRKDSTKLRKKDDE